MAQHVYPTTYDKLPFEPYVDEMIRTDTYTGVKYRNFTLVNGAVYGRLPEDRAAGAYLHLYNGSDLMVNVPSRAIEAVLSGKRDLDWLNDLAVVADGLTKETVARATRWYDPDEYDEDYDPTEEAWLDYWNEIEKVVSERLS